MKRKIIRLFSLLLGVAVPSVRADTENTNGVEWSYSVSDGHAAVARANPATGNLVIPVSLGGNPVTSIGNDAFAGCSELTSITIPDGVTSIGQWAFYDCSGLTSVTIPDGMTRVGEEAFRGCSDELFDTISISGVKLVDGWAVGFLGSLSGNLDLTGIRGIGDYAFLHCSGLTSIMIPDSVTIIGEGAFEWCSGLTSVTIPGSVTNIGAVAFNDCSGLKSIMIPDSVTKIGYAAFSSSGLTSIAIPDSVTIIEGSAFRWCSGLETIVLPASFRGRTSDLSIPDGCHVIFRDYFELVVVSRFGHPEPAGTNRFFSEGTSYSCSVEAVVADGADSGIRHVCTGWTGTGSVPAAGTGTTVTFVLEEDSTLTWNWTTNYWIDCKADGLANAFSFSDWFPVGTVASIPFPSDPTLRAAVISGDTNGVVVNFSARLISIPADGPRHVCVRFFETEQEAAVFTDGSERVVLSSVGNADWSSTNAIGASDGLCLRSGVVGSGESSTVETSVSGSGLLSFRWKISGNRGDWLRFFVDGVETNSIDRDTDWADVSLELGSGDHILRWSWEKSASTAAGENGGFLDDVCWKPYVWLDVQSEFGATVPGVGSMRLVYGNRVDASVSEPAPSGGTRRVCIGWTGTGSAPASGTGHETSFVIRQDTSLVWNWRTDHWIDVAVTGDGSTAFSPQWIPHGTDATVEIVPATHLFEITLSGDTDGAVLSGTTLSVPSDGPRTISVGVREVKLSLDVGSVHGEANPAVGNHLLSWGTQVSASVAEPAPTNGVRYVCLGWTGTGDVPVSGSGTNVAFTVSGDSSLVWQWQTNVWQSLSVSGPLVASLDGAWFERGTTNLVYYETLAERFSLALSGDTNGVVWDREARTLAVPADDPRDLALDLRVLTLAVALDANGFGWTTAGAAPWIPIEDPDAENGVIARSGEVCGSDESILATTVSGPGTLSWTWKLEGDDLSGVDVEVDGRYVLYLSRSCDWTAASIDVSGSGEHIVRFVFWNVRTDTSTPAGLAWIDNVAWTGAAPPGAATKTTEAPVPYAWLAEHAPAILEANGGNFENAANAIAANGRPVWECFVANLDPEDPTSDFHADIVFSNGVPIVAFDPDLGNMRIYEIDGKEDLGDAWGPTNDLSRFFRARVSLPEFWSPSGAVNGFPETVTVILDPNGGSVDPAVLVYTSPGLFGDLPIPVLGDMPFAGWYSRPEDGVRISSRSCIPWTDATLHARWGVYSIHFEGNGGAGEMEDVVDLFGVDMPLPQNRFVRTGYTFMGWSLRPSGVVVAEDGDVVPDFTSEPASTVVLYARWLPISYTVRFDANGGEGTMPDQSFVYDSPDTLSSNAFVRSGFTFVGWGTNLAGRISFADGETVSNLVSESGAVLTLYAQWLKSGSAVYVSFETAGGEGDAPDDRIANPGEIVTLPANPFVRRGYTFSGWAVLPGGEPVFLPGDEVFFDACATLFAAWTPIRYAISFDANGGEGTMAPLSLTVSDRLPDNTFTKSGAVFLGWSWSPQSARPRVSNGASVSDLPLENGIQIGLHAVWGKCIRFLPNGGSDVMDDVKVAAGDFLPPCPFVREGFTFVGWGTDPDGPARFADESEVLTMPTDSIGFVSLYAIWTSTGLLNALTFGIDETGNAYVSTCHSSAVGVLNIPVSYHGHPVTGIREYAFQNCSRLTVITIPDGVTSIGIGAFSGCSQLASIALPDSITAIEWSLFASCSALTSIDIPSCVTYIGGWAFWGSGLMSIAIPDSVTYIGQGAFEFCSGLTSITIPDSVTSIGSEVFRDCSGLMTITIPDSVESIGVGAFESCSGLTGIVVSENNSVFDSRDNCNAIIRTEDNVLIAGCKNTMVPDDVTCIGIKAFFGCSGLTTITIPDSVTSIGESAFDGCSSLATVTIPDSVSSIGRYAFLNCSSLTTLSLPGRFEGNTSNMGIPSGCTVTFRD